MYVRTGTDSSPSSFGKRSNRLNSDLSNKADKQTDYVEIVANGVKTYGTLLSELAGLTTFPKCNLLTTKLIIGNSSCFACAQIASGVLDFGANIGGYAESVRVAGTSSFVVCQIGTTGATERATEVPRSGLSIRIYY